MYNKLFTILSDDNYKHYQPKFNEETLKKALYVTKDKYFFKVLKLKNKGVVVQFDSKFSSTWEYDDIKNAIFQGDEFSISKIERNNDVEDYEIVIEKRGDIFKSKNL